MFIDIHIKLYEKIISMKYAQMHEFFLVLL